MLCCSRRRPVTFDTFFLLLVMVFFFVSPHRILAPINILILRLQDSYFVLIFVCYYIKYSFSWSYSLKRYSKINIVKSVRISTISWENKYIFFMDNKIRKVRNIFDYLFWSFYRKLSSEFGTQNNYRSINHKSGAKNA